MFTSGLFSSGRRQKSNVYIRRHQGAKCAHRALVTGFITNFHTAPLSIRSMRKNVNVMLEFNIVMKIVKI